MGEENQNKKPDCPHCNVSDETISRLKNSGQEDYESKKEKQERDAKTKAKTKKVKRFIFWSVVIVLVAGLIFGGIKLNGYFVAQQANSPKITVYYSPTCSCCKDWIVYMRGHGFNVGAVATNDAILIKDKYDVPEFFQGCHTSVIDGYVVEGMVPYEAINKMLADKPAITGIALPGMPDKAPGMPGYDGSKLAVSQIQNGTSSEFSY